MKDEIKEILDEMLWQFEKYPNDDFIIGNKESRILLDYITTLQEENETLKSIIKQIKTEFNKKGNPCFTFYGFWLKVRDILGNKND